MNVYISTALLLAGLIQASSGTVTQRSDLRVSGPGTGWAITPSSANAPVVAGAVAAASGDNLIGLPLSISSNYTRDNVLVVPTPDLPPGSVAALTQDLAVMCRIFGTAVPFTGTGKPSARPAWTTGTPLGIVIGPMTRGAQALYLDGYGALFFLHVDYPLVPTESQDEAQTTTPEPADPVWTRTVQEMAGQADEELQAAHKAPAYDPRKVEELRQTLIKTLVHCANIRMRRPQDMITLVVGDLDESKRPSFRMLPATRYGLVATASPSQSGTRPPTGTLLVLRVTKADVDAFAQKQLTLDQFTEKVQVLFSPGGPGAPAATSTPPTPVGTRR